MNFFPDPDPVPDPEAVRILSMPKPTVPAVAHVECRSEGKGEETPIAVVHGGQRYKIVDILDRAAMTSVHAGGPVCLRLWVELEDGGRCELTRVLPDGDWRVRVER